MNETEITEISASADDVFRISRMTLFMAALIPCCAMLMLPGYTFGILSWNVHFFTTGAVVLLAAACLCFVPDRVVSVLRAVPVAARAALGGLFLIGLYHVIRHAGTYQIKDAGMCFLYTAVPLYGMVFRRELLKLLPWLFSLFWLLNMSSSLLQRFLFHQTVGGIPSNLNWNASFTLLTGAVLLFLIFSRLKNKTLKIVSAAIVVLPMLYIEWLCSSRGLVLAVLCALLAVLWLRMKTPQAKKLFRLGTLGLLILAVSGVLAALRSERGKEFLQQDDRVFFAATVPDMIAQAPVLGYGAPSFEQEYLPWRNAGFFLLPSVSDRVDHPHNDMLFTAAGYGIAGLICWLILCFTPLIRLIQGKADPLGPLPKLLFFLFLILLIHAQLDLIFFHIPLAVFSTLILGILWGELHPPEKETAPAAPCPVPIRGLSVCAGALLVFSGLFSALANLTACQLLYLSEKEMSRACEVTPDAERLLMGITEIPQAPPQALFAAAAHSFPDGVFRPKIILSACEALDKTPVPDYGHINMIRASALEQANRLPEAEIYYLRENELFPLEILPLLHLSLVYWKMDDKAKLDETERAIQELMPRKGIDKRDIPLIIDNPRYDMRPWHLPGKKLQNGKVVPADTPPSSGQN